MKRNPNESNQTLSIQISKNQQIKKPYKDSKKILWSLKSSYNIIDKSEKEYNVRQ